MKTIKIIDLLNEMANGEKLPTSIMIDNCEFRCIFGCYIEGMGNSLGAVYKLDDILNNEVQIIEEILNKDEKEYLSAVIKPFKSKIKGICLIGTSDPVYIRIELCGLYGDETIALPFFEKDKMYKNMEAYREYTLKELRLD